MWNHLSQSQFISNNINLKLIRSKSNPLDLDKRKFGIEMSNIDYQKDTLFQKQQYNNVHSPFFFQKASKKIINLSDFDYENLSNLNLVSHHANDIFEYLKTIESNFTVEEHFLKFNQTKPQMRVILIEWINNAHNRFEMKTETFFLAVNILDNFLSKKNVPPQFLQKYGVTCLFIAAKYEEIYPPSLSDYQYITDNSISKSMMLKAEEEILLTLNFKISKVSSYGFLQRFCRILNISSRDIDYLHFLLELSIFSIKLATQKPSQVAASCIYYLIKKQQNEWTSQHSKLTGYDEQQIQHLCKHIHHLIKTLTINQNFLTEIKQKFASNKFSCVSLQL